MWLLSMQLNFQVEGNLFALINIFVLNYIPADADSKSLNADGEMPKQATDSMAQDTIT